MKFVNRSLFVVFGLILASLTAFGGAKNIRINEVYYDPPGGAAEERFHEFIELYVVEGGFDPSYWYVTDWDAGSYWEIPPSCPVVNTGEFIVIHIGPGENVDTGPVYHFYMNSSESKLSNLGEPISLHEDNDSSHDRLVDRAHDFMVYNGGTDTELALCSPWAGWPNDGVNPTDPGPSAPADQGKSVQLIGEDLDNGSNWKAGPPTVGAPNSVIPVVQWAADLAQVKALADGTVVGATAVVHTPIGLINFERRQFWLQDHTAGILIDNTPEMTTRNYAEGDVLCVTGTLMTERRVRQIVLEGDPGAPVGTAPLQSVQPLTVAEYRESVLNGSDEYQSELIQLTRVFFDATPPSRWQANTSYRIRDAAYGIGSATAYIRIEDGCELVGESVPKRAFHIVGQSSRYDSYPRILPRYLSDISFDQVSCVAEEEFAEYR